MPIGKSIRVFLADSNVMGIRYAELVNWTGQALACPRSRLSELKKWPEIQKPGVYFLFERRYGDVKPAAYIGESENVMQRLTDHDRKKDFWNEVVMFTSKDENLTKAHVKYLESTLVGIAKAADRYDLQNGNTPTESGLPRADRAAMTEYIENLRMVLGTLGYSILEPILKPDTQSELELSLEPAEGDHLNHLQFEINNCTAKGAVTDEGFVLKKGSQISIEHSQSMPKKVGIIKEQLLKDNILTQEADYLVAAEDILFSSSSYAAAIVAGTSRSGPQSWKTLSGKTLKSIEDEHLRETIE